METTPATPKPGRPPKPPGEKYRTPNRSLGRVSDADWAEIQTAADGNLTAWAVSVLLAAARRKAARQ